MVSIFVKQFLGGKREIPCTNKQERVGRKVK